MKSFLALLVISWTFLLSPANAADYPTINEVLDSICEQGYECPACPTCPEPTICPEIVPCEPEYITTYVCYDGTTEKQAEDCPTVSVVEPEPEVAKFRHFKQISYTNIPDEYYDYGEDMAIIYHHTLFDSGRDEEPPTVADYEPPASGYVNVRWNEDAPELIINIEKWSTSSNLSDAEILESANNYATALNNYRAYWSGKDTKLGLYGMIPNRSYWSSLSGSDSARYKAWQASNDRLKPGVDAMDFIAPSLYTFYEDRAGWETYARAHVDESRRIGQGKPVYCYLWPRYHDSHPTKAFQYLEPEYLRLQLEITYEICDGAILWDTGTAHNRHIGLSSDFSTNGFWDTYKEFIQSKR